MTDIVVLVLCAVGVFFAFTAAVGIIRMPDVYTRVQASTKCLTMGTIPLLVALVVAEGPITSYGGRALVVAFLMFLLGPAAGHALARAAYKARVPLWRGSVVDEPRQEEKR